MVDLDTFIADGKLVFKMRSMAAIKLSKVMEALRLSPSQAERLVHADDPVEDLEDDPLAERTDRQRRAPRRLPEVEGDG